MRTSLDLELDLQASLTRQSRLNDELQALRDLRQKLEELKAQGETDLPPGVLEDERFQKLLKQAEKQVWSSGSPQQGLVQVYPRGGIHLGGGSQHEHLPILFLGLGAWPPHHCSVLPAQILLWSWLSPRPQGSSVVS